MRNILSMMFVLIGTFIFAQTNVTGVVVDSNSRHEFNENYIKAKALIDLFK